MPEKMQFNVDDPSVIAFLKKNRLFRDIEEEEAKALVPALQRLWYRAHEVIFCEGDPGDSMYLIEEGSCSMERAGRVIKVLRAGEMFGEVAMIDHRPRIATFRAAESSLLYRLEEKSLQDETFLPCKSLIKIYKTLGNILTSYIREEDAMYREMDVLLVQDGGCAPGYNPVTAFVTQFLEQAGYRIFIAAQGFKSLVSGQTKDFRCLVYSSELFAALEKVPGILFAPPLREARGANFRTERYREFVDLENQKRAAENIVARKVKILVGIGGNGTFAGIKSLCQFLPENIQVFFIPVTIDSDVYGTECIGEHTGVEIGAEKIRCYMADARTHNRCYIIEMMGADGGYHALHSCLGAGAHLAVMPHSEYSIPKVAAALSTRDYAVIVVAEGYKKNERKEKKYAGNAAEYFRDELVAANIKTSMRMICEPFSRDIRGALPNNMDITLAQRMARKLTELVLSRQSQMMPAVLSGREYSIRFDQIRTDNFVESELAVLANRLTV